MQISKAKYSRFVQHEIGLNHDIGSLVQASCRLAILPVIVDLFKQGGLNVRPTISELYNSPKGLYLDEFKTKGFSLGGKDESTPQIVTDLHRPHQIPRSKKTPVTFEDASTGLHEIFYTEKPQEILHLKKHVLDASGGKALSIRQSGSNHYTQYVKRGTLAATRLAFFNGAKAYWLGRSLDNNPFTRNKDYEFSWQRGWDAAKETHLTISGEISVMAHPKQS